MILTRPQRKSAMEPLFAFGRKYQHRLGCLEVADAGMIRRARLTEQAEGGRAELNQRRFGERFCILQNGLRTAVHPEQMSNEAINRRDLGGRSGGDRQSTHVGKHGHGETRPAGYTHARTRVAAGYLSMIVVASATGEWRRQKY